MEIGERKSLKEFASLIGVSRSALSMWLNGDHLPDRERAGKLAQIFGPEVYDLLNMSSHDPLLQYVTANWERLPEDVRHRIGELIEPYTVETQNAPAPKPRRSESAP